MRVLVATSSYPVQNNPYAGIFIDRNVEALEKKKVTCTVIRPGPAKSLANTPKNRKIVEIGIRKNSPGSFLGPGFPEAFLRTPLNSSRDLLRCIFGMTRAIQNAAIGNDAIIAHWAVPAGLASLIATRPRRRAGQNTPRVFIWLHSTDVYALERIPGGRRLARKMAERAFKVLAVSRDLANRFEELARAPKGSVLVLHPGTTPGAPPETPPAQPFRAIFVGRLEKIKGVELIPDIAGAMPHWEFTVVGKGSLLSQLSKEATNHPNLQVVPGLKPTEVRQELVSHHLLILPGCQSSLARTEGLPTVLLEALDAGRPVVAADSGGVRELVTETEGYVVKPGSKSQIVAALRSYEGQTDHWCNIRQALHDKAAGFSADRAAQRIMDMLK